MHSGPRRYDRFHSVLWAAAARESGYQLRGELLGVEVPPTPFIGMISKAAVAAAVRTRNARADVLKADLDSAILEP